MPTSYNVRAIGHLGKFHVGAAPRSDHQLVFVGSHPGVAWTPVGRDRILAQVTVTNEGPRAIRAYWDGPPPDYQQPSAPARPVPTSPTDQFAIIFPNNSMTMVVGRAVKLVYAPEADPGDTGTTANGEVVVSWCCPPVWNAQASASPPVVPLPVDKQSAPAG